MNRVLSAALALFASMGFAHVGSPDVFYDGEAGPYRVFVAIQPPEAVPGLAQVSVRVPVGTVREVRMTGLPLEGLAAANPPGAELAERSARDPQFFKGSLWLMTPGSWQARIEIDGEQGRARLSVPVGALPTSTAEMTPAFAAMLLGLLAFLVISAVRIAAAAGREALLEPGMKPSRVDARRARRWQATAVVVIAVGLIGGRLWWSEEALAYGRVIYKPLELKALLIQRRALSLELVDPGWLRSRHVDDLVPDHDHLMHLFVVRVPQMDRMFHLHPERVGPGQLVHTLPPMPPGRYQLFGDIVHATGLSETLVTELEFPAIPGKPLEGDDSTGIAPPLPVNVERTESPLANGAKLVWIRDGERLRANSPSAFRFQLQDAAGAPLADLEPYMGMLGHAAFVKADRSVFAHVHPTGSVSMAALSIAKQTERRDGAGADPEHCHPVRASEVTFPYAFPRPGWFRVFVQVKRAGTVETATFDVEVLPS